METKTTYLEDAEKVYHYCSIETLDKILSNKTIRFGRFDQMDDRTETEGLPEKMNKSYYLSCWVDDYKEKIPQWAMYAPKGVRIEFPLKWYIKHRFYAANVSYEDHSFLGDNHPGKDAFYPFPYDVWHTECRHYGLLLPLNEQDGFVVKVEYGSDFKERKEAHWHSSDDGQSIAFSHIGEPMKYKDEYWSFQDEIRFYLFTACPKEKINTLPDHFDIPINHKTFEHFKIRMYPNHSQVDLQKVKNILKENFPGLDADDVMEESELDGKYFPKNLSQS